MALTGSPADGLLPGVFLRETGHLGILSGELGAGHGGAPGPSVGRGVCEGVGKALRQAGGHNLGGQQVLQVDFTLPTRSY